jgi:hypothetical protein
MATHEPLFMTTLQAFGAIGLPVTFLSSLGAFVQSIKRAPADEVAAAVNEGMARGFVPGSALAAAVFVQGVWF